MEEYNFNDPFPFSSVTEGLGPGGTERASNFLSVPLQPGQPRSPRSPHRPTGGRSKKLKQLQWGDETLLRGNSQGERGWEGPRAMVLLWQVKS